MSYRADLLNLFQTEGAMSIATMARLAVDRGLVPEEVLVRYQMRGVREDCRQALKDKDIHGLPIAGPSQFEDDEGDGGPIWVQRELWDFETYAINIAEHVGQRDSNHGLAIKLHDECFERHGRAPSVPKVSEWRDEQSGEVSA